MTGRMSQTKPDLQTIPEAKVKREFADKFLQYDFDWQKMPQEKEEDE